MLQKISKILRHKHITIKDKLAYKWTGWRMIKYH